MKNTKKSLLTSALCLLLCMSMLVGTTFAWFTDEVKSGNNIIAAGNLDVNLYWSTNGADWTPVDADTNVFKTGTLWEPGHTEVVYLKVANEGTLALKYNLDVIVVSEVPGTNVANDPFKLSDYILYNVYEGIKDYADSAAARGDETGKQLNVAYNKTTTLKAGEQTVLTLVAFMPTTVGNEANYLKDTAVPTINLGINLFATQETYEKDSYGDQYDANATLCNFVVANEAELIAALAEAKTGDVIGINGNVTWATGAAHGSTPFGTDATYITLIGLGEDATFTATGSGVGPVGIDNGTVVFKNLKIADESVSYNEGAWEFGYLEFRGNTVFENCEIVNAIQMEGENASFKNCSFNSNKDSEYAVWVCSGDATFEGCYFTGSRGIKIHEAYGSEVGKVVINNNEFLNLSKKPGLAIGDLNADTAVVLTNNIFAGTQAGDQGKFSYETDTDVTKFDFIDAGNIVGSYADTNAELKDQLQNDAVVILPEGNYTLPTLSGKDGITIVGAEGVVIGGENTATGFGGNFGQDTTIKNLNFIGSTNGVRSSYAQGGTTTFENCTFAGDSTYGFHIDQSNGATFIFNNCTFSGFNAFAGDLEKVIFNNCTFLNNGNYGHTNIWSVAELNNCTFGEGTSIGPRGDSASITIDGVAITGVVEF